MNKFAITNQRIYKEIAKEAYQRVLNATQAARRLNPNGIGEIITFDPNRTSFKNSFICIVFSSMWLEALLHTKIVEQFGLKKFQKLDNESYEKKLACLGINDGVLLKKVCDFRLSRKVIVHEKSYFEVDTFVAAQDEAAKAIQLMEEISEFFPDKLD